MENNHQKIANERRSGSDRRNTTIGFDFPYIDSHGHLVIEDRRKSDRRNMLSQEVAHLPKSLEKQQSA